MKIAVNKAHFPVTVLGPGQRIGIWVQGCGIGCKGCVSQDTWAKDPGREITVARLLTWCREVAAGGFDGVTISGGEPFDQPQALRALLKALHQWRAALDHKFDILCYSGYPLTRLRGRHAGILELLDAIIAEPYVENLPITQLWRGSSNQSLVPLSDLGRERFLPFIDAAADSFGKRIQTLVEAGRVWYIGIPARGDMAALEKACRERGIKFGEVSWRQ